MLTLHSFCKSKSCEKTAGGCWMQPRHRLWCALFGFFFLWFHKVRHPLHRSLSIQLGMFWCLFFHDFFLFGFHKFCWYFIHPLLRLHHLECELCHFSHRRWSFCCGFGCLLLWRLCHLGKVLCKRLWVLRINNTFGKNMSLELGNIGHLVGMRKCFELIRKENTWNSKCKKGHALAGCRMLPTKDFEFGRLLMPKHHETVGHIRKLFVTCYDITYAWCIAGFPNGPWCKLYRLKAFPNSQKNISAVS